LVPPPDRIAYVFDGKGGGRACDPDTPAPAEGEAFVWRHVHRVGDPEAWAKALAGLDAHVRDALTAEDTRPRCSVFENGVLLFLRGVNLNPGAEPDDMISLRLWVGAREVVSVWLRPLRAIGDVLDAIGRGQAPSTPGDLVAKLALRLVDRMEPTVAELNESVDDLEDKVTEPGASMSRGDLAEVRRQAIVLRRFVAPQRDALSTLSIEDLGWLTEKDRHRLREAADRTTRLAEELEAVRERAAVVQDQLMDRRSEEMNRRMLILSVVASVFLPLGLLTGLLGINVGGMPGAGSDVAFWIVCGLLVAMAGGLVWLFRRMKLI
ncbi:MAG: zinc transporter ZntB, partial [Maricaulaceae bacterium]